MGRAGPSGTGTQLDVAEAQVDELPQHSLAVRFQMRRVEVGVREKLPQRAREHEHRPAAHGIRTDAFRHRRL